MKIITNKDISMYDFFKLCDKVTFRTRLIKVLKEIALKEYYIKFPVTSYKTAKKMPFYIDVKKAPSLLTHNRINSGHCLAT